MARTNGAAQAQNKPPKAQPGATQAAGEPIVQTMKAKPGMRFVAKVDCMLSKPTKEGEVVFFSPEQDVPLNLVALMQEDQAEAGEAASQAQSGADQSGAATDDSGTTGAGEADKTGQQAGEGEGAGQPGGANADGSFQA